MTPSLAERRRVQILEIKVVEAYDPGTLKHWKHMEDYFLSVMDLGELEIAYNCMNAFRLSNSLTKEQHMAFIRRQFKIVAHISFKSGLVYQFRENNRKIYHIKEEGRVSEILHKWSPEMYFRAKCVWANMCTCKDSTDLYYEYTRTC